MKDSYTHDYIATHEFGKTTQVGGGRVESVLMNIYFNDFTFGCSIVGHTKEKETHRDPLLLTDFASDVSTGPEANGPEVGSETTQATTVTNCFSVLPNGVAWAEIGDDA